YSGTAVGILTLGGTDLVSLTSPVTPIQRSVLKKKAPTLGTKVLTCGAIKGLTACCVCLLSAVSVCLTASTLLWMVVLCSAIQSSVHELTGRRTVLCTNIKGDRKCKI
ncbi:unnamed protein product, partial [Staurois parvus]